MTAQQRSAPLSFSGVGKRRVVLALACGYEDLDDHDRLYFSSVARRRRCRRRYVLVSAFRRVALRNTELARAQCGTIRERLFKIGGIVRISARRVYLSLSSTFPLKSTLRAALQAIDQAYPVTA